MEPVTLIDFEHMNAVNVRAVLLTVQAALTHMTHGGRIATTDSVSADRPGFPRSTIYSMIKAAVAGLTRGMARDFGSRGIMVIQPRPTETDVNDGAAMWSLIRPPMAIARMGQDIEVASLAAYHASAESGIITGAAITVDGGCLA
jgi:3-oxoacyl-[acyl-carrier protein] reductase